MGLDLPFDEGQLPLDEDEKEGLLIPTITLRNELDEWEQRNVLDAFQWTLKRKFSCDQLLTEDFLCQLHERMFGNVWKWAGTFRKTNKNFGCDWHMVGINLRQLLDDARYWVQHNSYPPDELVIRFKHRLVNIHCFPNRNGRHCRLMADLFIEHCFGEPAFTWGRTNLVNKGEKRSTYLRAIRAADAGDIRPLIDFARS